MAATAPRRAGAQSVPADIAARIARWQRDWPLFAREALGVNLDDAQAEILRSVQRNPRTVVKSGHARGKDFVAAVASLCFLYLRCPSKVISTAPTQRQVINIMMSEAKTVWGKARIPLGGQFNTEGIKFADSPDWFMLGFKAGDKATEDWTGFHSPNLMVVVTEASGLPQETFNAIEGLLTGDSRLLLVLNPNQTAGEAYSAFKDPQYSKFTLDCLDAPNVTARRVLIPGQVDWPWVNDHVHKAGWCQPIPDDQATPEEGDFRWEGTSDGGLGEARWYRPSDLFRVKVRGLWPREPETQLIPLAWVEAAQERWRQWRSAAGSIDEFARHDGLRLGADVAGMGVDLTVLCWRYGPLVREFVTYGKSDHMATVGHLIGALEAADAEAQRRWAATAASVLGVRDEIPRRLLATAYVDTIGEGAGVHSRLAEQGANSVSVKFSQGAEGLADLTGERRFRNMRAYCWWAIRDALDPKLAEQNGGGLMLPPGEDIVQDLTAPQWTVDSGGRVVIEAKDDLKVRLGRSPDYGDALANTFYPHGGGPVVTADAFAGVGVF